MQKEAQGQLEKLTQSAPIPDVEYCRTTNQELLATAIYYKNQTYLTLIDKI